MEMNHCSVARKMMGLWQRQQCGYECSSFSECISTPRFFSSSTMGCVGLEDFLAVVFGQAVAHDAGGVHVGGQVELVLHAGVEVVRAVRGRGVDHARALIHGDVVGEHAEHGAIEERDGRNLRVLQFPAGEAGDDLRLLQPALCR